MRRLTVLSPHLDDAVFSLAFSLAAWHVSAVVTVVNFFTESVYAPYQAVEGSVSHLRRREDKRAFSKLGSRIHVRYLGLLDAPLRLAIATERVSGAGAVDVRPEDVCAIAAVASQYTRASCVLAPLALGDHVDHRTVRDSSLASVRPASLGFYEDLPYATWVSDDEICRQAAALGSRLGVKLVPKIPRASRGVAWKRNAAFAYNSQVKERDARAIANFGIRYRCSERIWVPSHSACWGEFLNRQAVA